MLFGRCTGEHTAVGENIYLYRALGVADLAGPASGRLGYVAPAEPEVDPAHQRTERLIQRRIHQDRVALADLEVSRVVRGVDSVDRIRPGAVVTVVPRCHERPLRGLAGADAGMLLGHWHVRIQAAECPTKEGDFVPCVSHVGDRIHVLAVGFTLAADRYVNGQRGDAGFQLVHLVCLPARNERESSCEHVRAPEHVHQAADAAHRCTSGRDLGA